MPEFYASPDAMAQVIADRMEQAGDTHTGLAQRLDVNRSIVTRALNHPSTRDLRTLRRALEYYDAEVDGPYFRVIFD